MRKLIFLIPVIFLILATTLTKNSTKQLDKKIFETKENIRALENRLELVLLDYNFLTSPKKLMEYQTKFFENNLDIDFLYTDYLKEIKKKDKTYYYHMKMPSFVSLSKNKYINYIPNSSVLIKSKIIKEIPYPIIRTRNDFLFWNLILSTKKVTAYNSNKGTPLFIYSFVPGISKRNFNLIKTQWTIYRKYFNYPIFDSLVGLALNFINSLIKIIKIRFFYLTQMIRH